MCATPHWVWCVDCGPRSRLEFHNPDKVHCADCGQVVGETLQPVEADIVGLDVRHGTIINAETGETLSGVGWQPDRVEVHKGNE